MFGLYTKTVYLYPISYQIRQDRKPVCVFVSTIIPKEAEKREIW